MIKSLVKKGEYFDSVSLMIVGKDVAEMENVLDATVVMATQENKSILKTAGLYLDEFEKYDDTDLLIVIKSAFCYTNSLESFEEDQMSFHVSDMISLLKS